MDRESLKTGVQRAEFTVPSGGSGVGISALLPMRSYTPNAKGLDPNEPFQFQGGSVTPTLDMAVKKVPNSALRLFFTVYPGRGDFRQAYGRDRVPAERKEPDQGPDATAGRRCAGPHTLPDDHPRGSHSRRQLRNPRHRKTRKHVGRFEHDDSLRAVRQTIILGRLLPRAFGPRDFMQNRCLRWGTLQPANPSEGRSFSTLLFRESGAPGHKTRVEEVIASDKR